MAMCKFIRILWHVTWEKSMPKICDFMSNSCLREVFFWLLWHLHVFILICVLKLREIFNIHFYTWTLFFSKGMVIVLQLMCSEYNLRKCSRHLKFSLVSICVSIFKNWAGFGLGHLSDSCLFMNSMVLGALSRGISLTGSIILSGVGLCKFLAVIFHPVCKHKRMMCYMEHQRANVRRLPFGTSHASVLPSVHDFSARWFLH